MVNPAITKTSLDLPVIASTQKMRSNLIVKSEIVRFTRNTSLIAGLRFLSEFAKEEVNDS